VHLHPMEKSDRIFKEINELSKESFTGIEIPPIGLLREQFDAGDVFVIVSDNDETPGKVLSFAIVTTRWDEPYIWITATDRVHRGQGLATHILGEIDEFVRKTGRYGVGLVTHVNNPAQKLYFDRGFRVVRVLPNYYVGFDGLMMRKELLPC